MKYGKRVRKMLKNTECEEATKIGSEKEKMW